MEALRALADSTSTQVSIVQACLSKILTPENASKIEGAAKALESLAKEDKICEAGDRIHRDVELLVLQYTR